MKEIIKIRAEINEIETKNNNNKNKMQYNTLMKTGAGSLRRSTKLIIVRLIKKKQEDSNEIRNERGDITTYIPQT